MIIYQCDPDLNTECPKNNCLYNKNAFQHTCGFTTSMKYAMRPVTPHLLPELFKEEVSMTLDMLIQALEEIKQDYVDDKHYFTALTLAIELIGRYQDEQ